MVKLQFELGIISIITGLYLSSSKTFQISVIINISIAIILLMSCGFFIPTYQMPHLIKLIAFPNILRLQFESFAIILFKERCGEFTPIVFNIYQINQNLVLNFSTLFITAIVLRFIGFIIFVFKSNSNH